MSRQFEGYSNLEDMMQKINEAHWESGMEAHSKMGHRIKESMEDALRRHKTNYTVKTVKGKRIIVKSAPHAMGDRFDRKTGAKLSVHMGNFIQWRTYSTTGTTVVGGLMKAGYTETRDEGKIIGKTPVYGVRQESLNILEKISTGKVAKAKRRARWVNPRGLESMDNFKGTHERHPTFFIQDGKMKGLSGSRAKISQWFKEAVHRRDDLKDEPMQRKV